MYKFFHSLTVSLLDLLFPIKCIGCQDEAKFICNNCSKKILAKEFQLCPLCKNSKTDGSICEKCKNSEEFKSIFFDKVIIAVDYDKGHLIQKVVKTFKYRLISDLNIYLGNLIYQAITKNIENIQEYIIIPIPLHSKRQKWRGFNQSELLCKYLAAKLNIPLVNGLKRIKDTKSQANLNREERLHNLQNAFTVIERKEILNKKIILIDDIATTLSTMNECAKVLKEAYAKEIICTVIGRGK